MHFKAKSVAALQMLLGDLPDRMPVYADPEVGLTAKTVGDLRKMTAWPDNLDINIPLEAGPEAIVRVAKASVSTRYAPKP